MQTTKLKIEGPLLIQPKIFKDPRGFFFESYQESLYHSYSMPTFVQDNHSYSKQGCIRGMHYQSFPGQAKLVRAAVGCVFDVVVDMRPESPTFKHWEGVILDDAAHHQLYIPVGFAHGFCVLSEEAHVLYKVSTPYNPQYEKGFRWDDPIINIQWPIKNPLVSERDNQSPYFEELR